MSPHSFGDVVISFMTSCLNTDVLKKLFLILRINNGAYDANPFVKVVRLVIRKNMMLNLNTNPYNSNCQLDSDATLLKEDVLFQFTTSTSDDVPLNKIEKGNINAESENIQLEIDNKLAALSTSICSLETCAIEYLAESIEKRKKPEKSKCDRFFNYLVDKSRKFLRDEQRSFATSTLLFFFIRCPLFCELQT